MKCWCSSSNGYQSFFAIALPLHDGTLHQRIVLLNVVNLQVSWFFKKIHHPLPTTAVMRPNRTKMPHITSFTWYPKGIEAAKSARKVRVSILIVHSKWKPSRWKLQENCCDLGTIFTLHESRLVLSWLLRPHGQAHIHNLQVLDQIAKRSSGLGLYEEIQSQINTWSTSSESL